MTLCSYKTATRFAPGSGPPRCAGPPARRGLGKQPASDLMAGLLIHPSEEPWTIVDFRMIADFRLSSVSVSLCLCGEFRPDFALSPLRASRQREASCAGRRGELEIPLDLEAAGAVEVVEALDLVPVAVDVADDEVAGVQPAEVF